MSESSAIDDVVNAEVAGSQATAAAHLQLYSQQLGETISERKEQLAQLKQNEQSLEDQLAQKKAMNQKLQADIVQAHAATAKAKRTGEDVTATQGALAAATG